jgi:hypothetical protein
MLIFVILAYFVTYRALRKHVLPRMNKGVLEESWETASIERATA